MPDIKTDLDAPSVALDKTALVRQAWRLMKVFWKTEETEIYAQLREIVEDSWRQLGMTEQAITELHTMQVEMVAFIEAAIEELVVERLACGNRQRPLLRAGDTQAVLMAYTKGETMDEELFAGMALVRPAAAEIIASTVAQLAAMDTDLYRAFWRFNGALMTEAALGATSPFDLIELPVARAQVIAALVSPEAWKALSADALKRHANVDVSDATDAFVAAVDDEVRAKLETAAAQTGPQIAAMEKRIAAAVRGYYRRRGAEIWPNTTGAQ